MKKSIYGSKHATEQWHLKIKEDEEKFWVLRKVKMTNWIFAKFKDGKYFSRFRHVDNVLLTSSDVQSTVEEKEDYLWHQDNSNLSEGLFAQRMEIHRDKRRGVLGLSQKAYLEKDSKEI